MQDKGYDICWGTSQRADGGQILRGNDLILGSVDVVVCDTLTGNILMKLFSSFTSGGDYETRGYGYVLATARYLIPDLYHLAAPGVPVIAGAILLLRSQVRGWLKTSRKRDRKNQSPKAAGEIPA
jgi:hypothetical protein